MTELVSDVWIDSLEWQIGWHPPLTLEHSEWQEAKSG
jgi:hypothetical protein